MSNLKFLKSVYSYIVKLVSNVKLFLYDYIAYNIFTPTCSYKLIVILLRQILIQ